ncbi:ABC transporter substrate binding protein, KPN_01854 family [Serratia fonticola]|uniref:ABC transporter substrate binding protein, KPN_01854 family n=1 Tax=Serratia fonticola TaxID=47917 RepID=A0A4U9TUY5_SERFO|nr:ABC transporter substrate binding protein, KPN_01854 family [Serratia fonticola]
MDPAKRLQIAGEAQKYLLDQPNVIPFFEEPQVFAGAPYLKGVNFEAVGRQLLWRVVRETLSPSCLHPSPQPSPQKGEGASSAWWSGADVGL